jgi:exonuclease SbcC
MIPMRVYVEGFMSYHDGAELLFDGAPLWALSGKNGAGKSAIFDAITFALYGISRLGKQNKQNLINQQADNLIVEFDFALGDTLYRAKRTLSRRGRGTYQISRIEPPRSSTGKSKLLPEPDTETEKSFEAWVIDKIGLKADTFTASVLLQQGHSEAMLEADPRIRHEMLGQIVDLSAYQRLYERAEEKRKEYQGKAKTYQDELKGLEPVDEGEFNRLDRIIDEEDKRSKAAQKRLRKLAELKVHAKNWDRLVTEQNQIAAALEEAKVLMAEASQIEQDAKRLEELTAVLPQLEYLLQEQQRLANSDKLICKHRENVEKWAGKLEKAQGELTQAQNTLAELKKQQERWQTQKEDAQAALLELASPMGELKQLDDARDELNELAEKLNAYPSDLDEQIKRLGIEVDSLAELKNALPWLKQFAQAREKWQKAKSQEKEAETNISVLIGRLSDLSGEQTSIEEQIKQAEAQVGELQQRVTKTGTLLEEAQKRLDRLTEVEGKPICSYCGQLLTPEHLDEERKRLEAELRRAKDEVKAAKKEHKQAAGEHKDLVEKAKELGKAVEKLEEDKKDWVRKLENTGQVQASAETQARTTLDNLPQTYRQQISPTTTIEIASYFEVEYPTQFELEALVKKVAGYDDQKQALDDLRQKADQRNRLLAQLEPAQNRLRGLEEKYPAEQAQEIRNAYQTAEERKTEAEESLGKLKEPLREAEETGMNADEAVKQAQREKQQASADAKEEEARQEEIKRGITNRKAELPATWQTIADSLTEKQLKSWQGEAESLAGADERLEKLNEARREQKTREQRLRQIQKEAAEIPVEARRPITELEQEEGKASTEQKEAEEARRQAENNKRLLEERHKRRCDLEAKWRRATQQAELHKELTRLLGRDHLQRYLLQQAELGIVTSANEILDRISGGTLRLELKQSQGTSSKGRNNKAAKALDIMAYNSEVGQKPILVALLSGSQRFRVAVSLALGIGQYMSQESRRIESVIIDEGFGGLDQDGRREMIDELHRLKDYMGRIILVSHQEEFAHAFVNRYEVTLEDGTSQVKRM